MIARLCRHHHGGAGPPIVVVAQALRPAERRLGLRRTTAATAIAALPPLRQPPAARWFIFFQPPFRPHRQGVRPGAGGLVVGGRPSSPPPRSRWGCDHPPPRSDYAFEGRQCRPPLDRTRANSRSTPQCLGMPLRGMRRRHSIAPSRTRATRAWPRPPAATISNETHRIMPRSAAALDPTQGCGPSRTSKTSGNWRAPQ